MTQREQIEQEIRDLLASESQSFCPSDKLFSPGGLFGQLAASEEERRAVAQSPLFKEAPRRLTEIQQTEAASFARAVRQVQGTMSDRALRLKIEQGGTG